MAGDLDVRAIKEHVAGIDQQIGEVMLPSYFIYLSSFSGQSAQFVCTSPAAGFNFSEHIAGKKDVE
ncbi:MAG: hypothetical protein IH612_14555 [Desulfofustis sp.]|nr:hypothetical protein [Desulfofustis sp.]